MIFLGRSFFADKSCVKGIIPTYINEINYVEISNALYDDLYLTSNTSIEQIPNEWEKDTYMWATFDGDTVAGNMNWYLDTIGSILLKRKSSLEEDWITIYQHDVHTIDDFNFEYKDYLCSSRREYTYAIVPVSHNDVEGSYITAINTKNGTNEIATDFNGITIYGKGKSYVSLMEIGDCNTSRVHKQGIVEINNRKKPKIIKNSDVNYDRITISGLFVGMDDEKCEFDFTNGNYYRKEFVDYLTDGVPIFVKVPDGRSWIAVVDGEPTDSMDGHRDVRIIEFSCVEVGDSQSEEDLYNSGLLDVEKKYWSNYY